MSKQPTKASATQPPDYKQQWKSAEQARWLANEEIDDLKRERDELIVAVKEMLSLSCNSESYEKVKDAIARATEGGT